MIAIDSRKLLSATVRRGKTGYFYWIGSDSWGAKIHPVRHQEWAAEGAITILPKRSSLEGELDLKDWEKVCQHSTLQNIHSVSL